ncbi:MAG: 16S rRNA processing protein RimM [Coriobacteriaceae bacterium]|nr:16S rRNA processing protein RimM [Coriobacteriaceae bacterium]
MPAAYKNIARVVRPHGSKGEVLVAPLRGLPLLLHEGMRVHITPPALKRERVSTVEGITTVPDGDRVRFSCAHNLDEAEALAGRYVLARVEGLDLDAMCVAYDDLIGRVVVDARHGELGTVQEVMETPANNVWVIGGGSFGEVLVPVIESVVQEIPSDGPIPVTIMDGLLDL